MVDVSPAKAAQIQRQFLKAAAAWLSPSDGGAAEEPGPATTREVRCVAVLGSLALPTGSSAHRCLEPFAQMNVREMVQAIAEVEGIDSSMPRKEILQVTAREYDLDLSGLKPFEQARKVAEALDVSTSITVTSLPTSPSSEGAAIPASPPSLELTQERAAELASTTLCNRQRPGSLAVLATPPDASSPPEQPEYTNVVQREFISVEQHRKIEVAAGKVADAIMKTVAAAINAQLGNLPALASFVGQFVGMLRDTTVTMASSSKSSEQRQSQVMLDSASQTLLLFRLHKAEKSKSFKIPVFFRSKSKVEIQCYFAMVQAVNAPAMARLRELERNKAQELLGSMEKLEVF